MVSSEVAWLLRRAWSLRGLYLVQMTAVCAVSVLSLVDPLALKWLLDSVIPWSRWGMLPWVGVGVLLFFLLRFGFATISRLIETYASQRLMFDLRRSLVEHLERFSARDLSQHARGDLLHRIENDVDQVSALGGQTVASLLRVLLSSTLSFAVMVALDLSLALIVVSLVPLMVLLRRHAAPRLKAATEKVQAAHAKRYGFLESHLSTLLQVQLLNRQVGERRRFVAIAREGIGAVLFRRWAEIGLALSSQAAMACAGAMVLGFGGYRVLRGDLSLGGLVAFYSLLSRILDPLETVVHLYSELQRAGVSVRRIQAIFELEPTIRDPQTPAKLPLGPLSIELVDAHFAYDGEPILRGLNLSIAAGERVALVGRSGSGKSTIAKLLVRQIDPDRGRIALGNVPVASVRLSDLRSRVAFVPQDPILFDVGLLENLRYACPNSSTAELERVLAIAQLNDLIAELGDGDVPLGPRGERLSGGQRQRVAIARALLQPVGALVLDEATSALDGVTEHRLLNALEASRDRTVVFVAHRLSAILWADRVAVVDGGQIVDSGRHADLYRCSPFYRDLVEHQLKRLEREAKRYEGAFSAATEAVAT